MFFLPFYLLWFLEILGCFDCRQISGLWHKLYIRAAIKKHTYSQSVPWVFGEDQVCREQHRGVPKGWFLQGVN